jgi:hypothetical protein
LINELSTTGPFGTHDEFLELRNVSPVDRSTGGMVVRFHAPTCEITMTVPLVDITGEGLVLQPGETLVLTGSTFSGTPSAPHVLPVAGIGPEGLMSRRAGAVTLNEGNNRLDAVTWGSAPCAFEGRPALPPPPGVSISRDIFGTDTDDNRCDFHLDERSA